MSNREFTATRTMLANAFATAGAELLECMGVSSALAAIPNTEPPQYVVAGTLPMIAKVLPATAAEKPTGDLTPVTALTGEQLHKFYVEARGGVDEGLVAVANAAIAAHLGRQAGVKAEQDERTYMDDKQAHGWAWDQVKRDVGTNGWTVGEHCNYFGFFLHGWRYGRQYERQGTTAAPASQEGAHAAPSDVRDAIARAYGYLWHVNANMEAPPGVVLFSLTPEQAAYKARRYLRDLLTHEQRGKGINTVREEMSVPACAERSGDHGTQG